MFGFNGCLNIGGEMVDQVLTTEINGRMYTLLKGETGLTEFAMFEVSEGDMSDILTISGKRYCLTADQDIILEIKKKVFENKIKYEDFKIDDEFTDMSQNMYRLYA